MQYTLRHFNTPLLTFEASESSSSPDTKILYINEEMQHLLPLDVKAESSSLNSWLRHRTIPANRAFVHAFLAKCGLSINRPMNIIKVSKGLSMNDCYWVTEEGFEGTFEKYNLYDNRFSNILGQIAFTGYGSNVRSSFASCPEFTTNGMLPKCWRRYKGKIMLFKGGTSGFSNTGNEPYSEYYAAQVAEKMGIKAVKYSLSKWKGSLCSACEIFTSKKYAFMPVGRIVTHGGMEAVRRYYEELGEEFTNALDDMLVLDALICNTDRHFGNFGFLIDNETNTIASPAPLFDHGNSLMSLAGNSDFESREVFEAYAATLMPNTYDDFTGTAGRVLRDEHREKLRHMLDFRFRRHSWYNLPEERLRMIESFVKSRAAQLLEY